MRMLRPFRRSAVRRHASARLAPSQTAAASSKVMPVGLCASGALSRTQTNSACAPKPMTPKTSSPTSNSLTAAPTASTSPASSMPRILRFGRRRPVKKRLRNISALRNPVSVRLTVVAWILTRTSSSLGTGRSTSSSRRTSGGPYLSWTTALMGFTSLRRHDQASWVCLGPAVAADCQDDVSCLLPRLDIAVRLDHLLQRVAPVDDRSELPRLDELLEEEDVILVASSDRHLHPLVADPPGREQHDDRLEHERPQVSGDIDPASLQRASSPEERILADGVDDRVVGLAVLREILLEVVDDLVGAERSHELDVLGVAHRRDVGAAL